MGVSGHFVAILRILKPPKQLSRPDLFPGQHLPHHPGPVAQGLMGPQGIVEPEVGAQFPSGLGT